MRMSTQSARYTFPNANPSCSKCAKWARYISTSSKFETYLLEARILRAQGNLIAAEGSYLTAWMNGSDEAEAELREFLKTKAFNYQIIPNAETICQKYNINLWPTHVILNRDGNLAQRITGGMNRHEELRRLIHRTLY